MDLSYNDYIKMAVKLYFFSNVIMNVLYDSKLINRFQEIY